MKDILNKWQFGFGSKMYNNNPYNPKYRPTFYLIKLTLLPEEGEMLQHGKHYKGFVI